MRSQVPASTASGREERRVAVARHDLRRDRLGREPEPPSTAGLDLGRVVGERADRAGQLADRDLVARLDQRAPAAAQLGVPARALEAEGDRLGVDAVRAADHGRVAVALGLRAARRPAGGRALARSRSAASRSCIANAVSTTSDDVSPRCRKRPSSPTVSATDVTNAMTSCLHLGLDLLHARRRSTRASRAERARRLGRDLAARGQRVDQRQLDLEPALRAAPRRTRGAPSPAACSGRSRRSSRPVLPKPPAPRVARRAAPRPRARRRARPARPRAARCDRPARS